MSSDDLDFVLVRGFRDKPAKLRFVARREGVVDAVGASGDEPMPFHAQRTYRFSQRFFDELERAFAEGSDQLSSLWSEGRLA